MKDDRRADRLLTVSDLAEYLNVCEHTIYRWCKSRKIPHFNLNSSYRFDPHEIRRWLTENHRQPSSERNARKTNAA